MFGMKILEGFLSSILIIILKMIHVSKTMGPFGTTYPFSWKYFDPSFKSVWHSLQKVLSKVW